MPESASRVAHLKFRHLQLLEVLLSEGTVHKAARALHMSQPAASAALREIEESFGARLFERTRQGVAPTAAAHVLAERVRAIRHELAHAADDVRSIRDGGARRVAIGAMPRVFLEFMPRFVALARIEWPEVRLDLEEGVGGSLVSMLQDGRLDCLISRPPHEVVSGQQVKDIVHTRLYDDGMVLVCGVDHPMARMRRPRLEQLARETWVLPPPDMETRRVFVNTFLQAGMSPPDAAIECRSFVCNMTLVERARLLTIAPASAARAWQRSGMLKVLPVRVDDSLAPISLISRSAQKDSQTIARLRGLAERVAREM
ncbi:MAG TPA: LysR substrate-binding domain-containing protein [Usitatibacter sp.]|nr:LysR substrate-binding domain-containing protein [Usitatibacter sp.]